MRGIKAEENLKTKAKEESTTENQKVKTISFKIPRFSQTHIPILMILLLIASFLLGSFYTKIQYLEKYGNSNQPTVQTSPQANVTITQAPQPTITKDAVKNLFNNNRNLVFGDKNSKNLIVEVADPSCPYCHITGGLNTTIGDQLGSQFKLDTQGGSYVAPVPKIRNLVDQNKAAFVWIYYPGHGHGEMGTKALYCANEQGKFWDAHDKLMSNSGYDMLNNQILNDRTKSQALVDFIGPVVNTQQLKSCIDSGKYDSKLQEDMATSTSLGITGTPGFIINTTLFSGAYSWNDMNGAVK